MKKLALILLGNVFFSLQVLGQTDSVKWALTTDTSAVAIGNVQSRSETFSNMVVRSYNGGVCQKSAPDAAGDWVTESAQNNTRYVQFAVSPVAGYNFTASSISFAIGWAGTTNHMSANVYYSTDSTFLSKTQLGSTITLQNSTGVLTSFTLNVSVSDGNTMYVRFYPWDNTTASGKSLGLTGFVVAGTASAVGYSIFKHFADDYFFSHNQSEHGERSFFYCVRYRVKSRK